jgi:hypothetical protein
MQDRRRLRLVALAAGWTLFVWITRVRNVLGDDALTTGGRLAGLALSASFLGLAGLVLAGLVVRAPWLGRVTRALAAWTVVVWLVRGAGIALGDHSAGFVVVHVALGIVSIGLALAAVRAVDAGSSPGPSGR